ncbi:MAG TPA: YerC/YecD family TrpR-related protein [Pseudogracilibacillus sp.]|nr:YerC/YecD family TrpR-related protein [Pseudogracilibacillus sp.]
MQIDKLRGEALEQFFEAILQLENKEECYQFFDDVATMNEIRSFAQRFEVANLLYEGKKYTEIEKKTKASTATISRVSRCLDFGSGGYRLVLDRMEKEK